jgi:phosphohistidine phosphatase SixA
MILYIVRHPEAKPQDETVNDQQRQVTKKGAEKLAQVLDLYSEADEMNPDVIFVGPETRNREAGEIARAYFDLNPSDVVQNADLAVGGNPRKVWDDIKAWVAKNGDPNKSEVVAIGSNPTLAALFQLVHGLGTKAGQSGDVKLKKGSVAKLKVYNIGDDDDASSELRSYVPPGLAGD